jgi:multiple sugar transport system ATP-binding protein
MTLGQRVAVLRLGVIQQVDAPQRLYHEPANVFVASFIGSPPMNFAHGTLVDGALQLGPYRLTLPERVAVRVARREGPVLAGFRPEHLQDARFSTWPDAPALPADVEITEQLGAETYAYVRLENVDAAEVGERPLELAGAFAARLDARSPVQAGERLTLAVDLSGIHLFDEADGTSILRG